MRQSAAAALQLKSDPLYDTSVQMASGRDTQLARQIGEYLAAAELGRRGWIATTFTGNLPGFDILAVNPDGRILEVQVKSIRSSTWQLNAGQFLEIDIVNGVQHVRGKKAVATRWRICVFIEIGDYGTDRFYVCDLGELQDIMLADYKGGARPNNPDTLHHALKPKRLAPFLDNWKVLDRVV